ncbi:MAG TPA: hypothetical protein PK683_16435 [Leptospiraceae bacterium]|nr:hypothetical protein [Leptospiraceae bacterium]
MLSIKTFDKAAVLIMMMNVSLNAGDSFQYFGTASDLNKGSKLYTDHHTETVQSGNHISSYIEYRDSSGKTFASKKISFGKSSQLPDFTLEDKRDGYLEGAELNGDKIRIFTRKNQNSPMQERTVTLPGDSVVDGGFDHYIRKHWDSFLAGKSRSFYMFAPAKQDFYKFKAFKVNDKAFKGKDAFLVRVELDVFALGKILPAIQITYDKKTKRILKYEGISNINDSSGKSHFVRLEYDYPNLTASE